MTRKPKILCVDDMLDNLKIRASLLELFGCEVLLAQDHSSALTVLDDNDIDLLLIDYHLANGATGEEVVADVRALRPQVKVIMLTGDAKLPDSARQCADAVLIKGASDPSDLLDAIERLISNKPIRNRRPPPPLPKSA